MYLYPVGNLFRNVWITGIYSVIFRRVRLIVEHLSVNTKVPGSILSLVLGHGLL